MRMKLITAVAAVALLAGGNVAFAQGGDAGHESGAAGASHERGTAGGTMGHEGGGKAGEKMGQGGGEKAGAREERKADQGEKGMRSDKGDRAERGEHGDRDHADRDRANRDRGERGDRADRGERDHDRGDHARDRAERGERENVHVNIRVGGAVPDGRRLAPLKTTLVERYPQYRGFQMFTENDEIIIVDPGTRKIVRTVSDGEAGMNHAASTDCR